MKIVYTPTSNVDADREIIDVSLTTTIEGTDSDIPADSTILSRWDTDEYNTMAVKMWGEMREARNQLLAETDYFALSDVTMTADMSTYRQDLRDLPANTVDVFNPVYPEKP
jgi:hypothetical protein